ncbi:MAG: oligosaccharide flippase family protein [Acidobacteria bacterium]|nr:oligosaccharide flippase family protein [Acidobacteriota bacterium]MBI3658200.1 oligosaccharide flippase family protein [Acidobacteriota bacterium]
MVYKNQYWLGYVAQLISFAALLAFNTVLPRAIGVENFAMISLGYSVVFFGTLLLDEGFNVEVVMSKRRDWYAIIKLKMVSCAMMCLAISGGLPWALHYLDVKPAYMGPLQVFALNIVFVPFVSAVSSYFIAVNRNDVVILINIVAGVIITAIPLTIALLFRSEWAIVNSITISYALITLVSAYLFFKDNKGRTLMSLPAPGLLLKSIDQSAGSLTNVFFTWGIFIILTKYYGIEVAVYNKIAYSICNAACALLPLSSMNLYKLVSFDDAAAVQYFKKLLLVIAISAVLGSTGLYLIGSRVIGLLLGEKLAASITYIRYLSFVIVLKAITDMLRPIVLQKFGHAYLLVASVASILAGLAVIWLNHQYHFIKVYHLYYTAYAALLALFIVPIVVDRMRKYYGAVEYHHSLSE